MSRLNAAIAWRPPVPFYYGWLIMGMAAVGTFAGTGLSQVVIGGIQDFILDDTGWNRRSLALAVTAGTWLSGLIGPLMGYLADRLGPRWLMAMGAALVGIAFFILAGAHNFGLFFGVYVVGRSMSNTTLIGIVPRTAAVNFFRRRRNIALANSLHVSAGG